VILKIGSIQLTEKDLTTHVHGIGKSRSGKSKLIELLCRQLVEQRRSFCLIDPHGSLFRDVLAWLAFFPPRQQIYLFEPTNDERIVGFNPFTIKAKDEARITTKAEKMRDATLRAWGVTDVSKTPRLSKWLKRLYYTLIEQDLSITAAECFVDYDRAGERNKIIEKIKNRSIKSYWQQLYQMKPGAFLSYFESTESRLEIFTHPQVRRILGLSHNCIDLADIINNQKILLVSLQSRDDVISDEATRVLGTLLINEMWQIFKRRIKPVPFYLIVDECQLYATPDIGAMLDQSAKYGLHLMLFHQRESHLPTDLQDALQNAQTKFIFSTSDNPKEQRHFTYINPNGERIEGQVPRVPEPYTTERQLEAYTQRLLKDFLTHQEVDALLERTQEATQEVSDDDLFR
jgi:DNA helicase HerA-like ATPase